MLTSPCCALSLPNTRCSGICNPKAGTAHPLPGEAHTLGYVLTEVWPALPFQPTEFTQVNPHINAMLVRRAMRLLELRPDDRVGDLFCGLGNFTAADRPAGCVYLWH